MNKETLLALGAWCEAITQAMRLTGYVDPIIRSKLEALMTCIDQEVEEMDSDQSEQA